MKQLSWTILTIVNLILGLLYLYGADHNRYICAWLWGIIPAINLIMYGCFEKYITAEREV